MPETLISLENVSHIFSRGTPMETTVLKDVSMTVKKGESVGIMGRPGSGKTTLAKILSGLITPSKGRVKTPGTGPGKIGLLFQLPEDQLFCGTVYNEITYSLRVVAGLSGAELEAPYRSACKRMGIDADLFRDRNDSEMSGGEKRRVAIASVLAMDPSILIFDEPTAGLDHDGRKAIMSEIGKLSAEGITTIIISHEIDCLMELADRLILIDNGCITSDGPAKDVLATMAGRDDELHLLPFVTEIMVSLNKMGLNVRRDIFDPDEALIEIKKAVAEEKKRGAD